MDISVITPIYRAERTIERCLRSLFTQTKTEGVEFILVDDASPDNAMAIAQKVAQEFPAITVHFLANPTNSGTAITRQRGLDAAKGLYTLQVDSDDWCEPTMLEELYNRAIQEEADIVTCDFFETHATENIHVKQPFPEEGQAGSLLLLEGALHGYLWNKLIKRSLYEENQIRFTPHINLGEDLLVTIPLFYAANKVSYLPKAFLHYVQADSSLVHQYSAKNFQNSMAGDRLYQAFVERVDAPEAFRQAVINRKLLTKSGLLAHTQGACYKACAALYPEATDGDVWHHPFLPIHQRVAMLLTNHRCWVSAQAIWASMRFAKRIIRGEKGVVLKNLDL